MEVMGLSDNKQGGDAHATQIPPKAPADDSTGVVGAPRTDQRWTMILLSYLIASLSLIAFLNSFGLGIVTIALPQIVEDLNIPAGLTLWPGTVNTLAIACCLLPAGAVADIIGNRRVSLTGTLVLTAFTVACGVAQNSTSFIVFRALAGVGAALVQSTSVSILSRKIAKGRIQNIAFSCLGLSIPFGYATGLILGGVFASTSVTWRTGFYLCGGLLGLLLLANIFTLPNDDQKSPSLWRRVLREVDWVGALIFMTAFALLSYSFSLLTTDLKNIHKPAAIATLCIGAILLPALVFWIQFQNAHGRVTLLPLHILKNPEFGFLCCIVFCAWASLNSMEWFFSIYFQEIQGLSSLQAAIRYLPNLIFGVVIEIFIGAFIHRLPIVLVVILAGLISSVSPLVMALTNPAWSYWRAIFWAMLLLPVAVDVLFTTAVLLITDIFPIQMHGTAGAVFNVVGQMGTAGGIAIMALIASGVSQDDPGDSQSVTNATSTGEIDYTLNGLIAVFWACFGLSILAVLLAPVGLRKRTYVGQKEATESVAEDQHP